VSGLCLQAHEFDESRFDVNVTDNVYYLRAESPEERQKWLDALDTTKALLADSGYGSDTPRSLSRYSSKVSLNSMLSQQSSSSFTQLGQRLREKLYEMETYREILCRQIDTLQAVFDSCHDGEAAAVEVKDSKPDGFEENPNSADTSTTPMKVSASTGNLPQVFSSSTNPHLGLPGSLPGSPTSLRHRPALVIGKGIGGNGVDFRGEAITFKATTAGALSMLSHCIDMMNKREEQWKCRLKKVCWICIVWIEDFCIQMDWL
jgi:collagen type IV alpha-3-binding protein